MNPLKNLSENTFKQALSIAGLGYLEYCHINKTITINDHFRFWLNSNESNQTDSITFATQFENTSEILNNIDTAFKNQALQFVINLVLKPDFTKLTINCQPNSDFTGFISIIELPNAPNLLPEAAHLQLSDTVPAIIWSTNAEGQCTYINQQWTNYTGMNTRDSLGLSWTQAVHEDDREYAKNKFLKCIENRGPYKVLFRLNTISGDYRWCIDNGTPLFSKEGVFEGLVGTVIDVHDEKIAIEESVYRQEELTSIVESAPFPIGVYIGTELRIKIANKSMLTAWGKGENVIGKLYTEILPELENQKVFLELQNVISTGIALHRKNTRINLVINGELKTHFFNYSFTPLFDSSGKVYGVMNTAADVTDLNLAQAKSQQNEMKFIKLLETAPAAIGVFVGRDLIIETHNSTFADVVGKGNEIVGKPLVEVMPELITEGQPFLEILDNVYTTGIPYETFGTQVDIVQNGVMTHNFYNFTYTPMFDENGKVYAILDIAVNVTENVHAQNKVLESEKSLRSTILKAPVAMCILKQPNFIVEIANNRMLELWQAEPVIIGKPLFDYLPDAREQGFEELLLRVVNDGETITASERLFTRIINQVAHNIYVDFIYEPYRDSEDKITGVMVVAHEVTQQVLARRKIEDAEARARLAIEAGDLGVYELNFETDELISSPRFDMIWGVESTENRSQLTRKIHPDDMKNRLVAHKIALKTGNLDYEARLIKDDGTIAWYRAKGKVLLDDDGVAKTLIGVVQDITEQKLFSEELTRLVRQRTTELERSNEDLQQFAHVASHDLKEPVRKIKFYSNMLQDQFAEILPPKGLMHLDKIQNATDRMFSMIEGVLKYSSIQGASKDIENIDLNTTFDQVESDLEVIIKSKNVIINRNKLPTIEGVTVLIHQLFYNIINNALKFSSVDKKPIINIISEIITIADKEMVTITISDNGIGLDPNYIGKIFNPFIRLNPKDQYEGTGLGLALCKKITEQHHGFISADGEYGVGATFTITLPIKQEGDLYTPGAV